MVKVLLENQRQKNDLITRMINNSFDSENKTQSKGHVSTKRDMSLENNHDTTVTQNSEPVRSKRNPRLVKIKKMIFFLGDSMVKHVEGWKLSKNVDRKHKNVCRIM